jgi:hypothetical protein
LKSKTYRTDPEIGLEHKQRGIEEEEEEEGNTNLVTS